MGMGTASNLSQHTYAAFACGHNIPARVSPHLNSLHTFYWALSSQTIRTNHRTCAGEILASTGTDC